MGTGYLRTREGKKVKVSIPDKIDDLIAEGRFKAKKEKVVCSRCGRKWAENERGTCKYCNCMTAEIVRR